MEKFLKFLSGKKSVIASILMTINGYCAIKWFWGYWEIEFSTISAIIIALFWAASIKTQNIYKK